MGDFQEELAYSIVKLDKHPHRLSVMKEDQRRGKCGWAQIRDPGNQ